MNIALKEWAAVVLAMQKGTHHVLLRKGGIADKGGVFRIEHTQFLLFPTYEHQGEQFIADSHKDIYRQSLISRPPDDEVLINSWAEVKEVFELKNFSSNSSLAPIQSYCVWSDKYLKMRLDYKPEKPLYLMVLRTYKLTTPRRLKNLPRYGGCRSWVPVLEDVDTTVSSAVMSDDEFQSLLKKIKSLEPVLSR